MRYPGCIHCGRELTTSIVCLACVFEMVREEQGQRETQNPRETH